MIHLAGVPRKLKRLVTNRFQREIYIVEGRQWVFYWIAKYLSGGLQRISNRKVHLCENPWELNLKNQFIYFNNRQKYFIGPFRKLHPSNRVFLMWQHGGVDELESHIRDRMNDLTQSVSNLERIVVPCSLTKEALELSGIEGGRIVIVPNGVDLGCFKPPKARAKSEMRRELGIPEDRFVIGSFQKDGTGWGDGLEPKRVKAPDVFLRVIEKLNKHHPNLWVLLTAPARGYMKQGLDRLNVKYTHRELGQNHYEEIARYYHALDLYLVTSRCEGGPLALIESWATGVPVVSTRVGMSHDLIRHRENGMIADVDDADGLAECVRELIENPPLRSQLAAEALKDVRSFDWPVVSKMHYEKLYEPFM